VSQLHNKSALDTPPAMPRWVKVFGAAVVLLVAIVVILHLTGNSLGPGMHGMPATHGMPQP
jgi:hypothetical protein